ncbi:MAG TPA: nitrilase-related carbon-nitrogen hydrolase [Solirubrobacteraceae bacterium]|jgi:N-carbamoylputrescine amidase|nr:nitrilase-related carbon-nitrogen hydrolase [Solirubrobacteraceae bacterium]
MSDYVLKLSEDIPESLARTRPAQRPPLRLGLVQQRWHPDALVFERMLTEGIVMAAEHGARVVCLQELTLSPYFAITPDGAEALEISPEPLEDGQTITFARRAAAESGAYVHASLFEAAERGDGLGYNTAILVAPDGELVQRTRKLHIPVTAGYYEDRYFRKGPASGEGDPFPVVSLELSDAAPSGTGPLAGAGAVTARLGLPTCWDQWFPELARAYSLAGAEVLIYPTAIGSEPDHPDFDTEPLWQQVIVGNGIANGTFMVAVNRFGVEGPLTFYGSSFISDPYGRILVQAPRDRPAVLVADLDLDQRRDWLELFPFLTTRRPDAYGTLTER